MFDAVKFAGVVVAKVKERLEPFESRLATVERRLADLEQQQTATKWAGVWSESANYQAGNFATYDGSIWHANIDSKGLRPGSGSAAWSLAVKRGKDAR